MIVKEINALTSPSDGSTGVKKRDNKYFIVRVSYKNKLCGETEISKDLYDAIVKELKTIDLEIEKEND